MGEQYIVVSSITYAYKAKDLLERKGFRVFIERASHNISSCGCHFVVRLKYGSMEDALAILSNARIRVLGTGSGES